MATIPGRERACLDAIESLIGQVEDIYLALNQYTSLPDWLPPGANAVLADGGDEEKLRTCPHLGPDVLFCACDDDLVYPSENVSRTLASALRSAGQILTYHGSILVMLVKRFYCPEANSTGSTRFPGTHASMSGARA